MSKDFVAFWAVIPATVLYDDRIPANAKLLYGQISTLTTYCCNGGACDATNAQLAAPNKLSEDSVSRLVKALEKAGHITVDYAPDPKDGHPVRSIRQVLASPLTGKNADNLTGKKTDPSSAKKSNHYIENNINNIYIPPKAPQGGQRSKREPKETADWKPERFEGFWRFYPRGEGRQAAIRAWDKLQPDDTLIATIGQALTVQKASPEWQAGVGIPYASTYLNQRRWTDEVRAAAVCSQNAESQADGKVDLSGLRFV